MLSLVPRFERRPRLLILGAHSDDIEIGCGGTVLRLLEEHPDASVCWVVFAAEDARKREALASAADFLAGAERSEVRTFEFPDSHFPAHLTAIKAEFEALKRFEPDLVITHCGHDLHQDHRVVSELTWNTFRGHLVLEYEVPKYDGDLRCPNVFVALAAETCQQKAALLQRHFVTQRVRPWFDPELFLGLMRIRGAECRSPTGYAEGFYARKVVVDPARIRARAPEEKERSLPLPDRLEACEVSWSCREG